MTDLTAVIHDLIDVFEELRLPYAIMGGIAVRAHGIPRPTYDVDFTLAVPRERLLVTAEDLILFKLVASRPRDLLDIQDILFTQGQLDETYLRRWAGPLGVEAKLDDVLASRE